MVFANQTILLTIIKHDNRQFWEIREVWTWNGALQLLRFVCGWFEFWECRETTSSAMCILASDTDTLSTGIFFWLFMFCSGHILDLQYCKTVSCVLVKWKWCLISIGFSGWSQSFGNSLLSLHIVFISTCMWSVALCYSTVWHMSILSQAEECLGCEQILSMGTQETGPGRAVRTQDTIIRRSSSDRPILEYKDFL